jgi:hypothetical protein
MVDEDLKLTAFNRRFLELLGFPAEDFDLGKSAPAKPSFMSGPVQTAP